MRGVVLFAAIFITVLGGNCFAQNSHTDTLTFSKAEKEAISYFNKAIGAQTEVYNGAVYSLYPSGSKGTFYFQDKNTATPSTIIYNGTVYKDVPVIFDVQHNQMVSFGNNQLFILVPENLSDVYLENHHFIYADVDGALGYYEELYGGKSQILLKRTKQTEEHIIPPQTAETWYIDKSQLYIRTNSRYVPISSRSALLKVFNNRRKEVEKYLDDNKLDFGKEPENTAAKAAAFYDRLTP